MKRKALYIRINTHTHTHTAYMNICICIYTNIYIHVPLSVHLSIYVFIYLSVCLSLCRFIYLIETVGSLATRGFLVAGLGKLYKIHSPEALLIMMNCWQPPRACFGNFSQGSKHEAPRVLHLVRIWFLFMEYVPSISALGCIIALLYRLVGFEVMTLSFFVYDVCSC